MVKLKLNNKNLMIAGLVALLILGGGGFIMYRQAVFSKEVVHLQIVGPEHIAMGNEVQYTVKYKNNGNFTLEKPRLDFELPPHSLTEDSRLLFKQDLEDMHPGAEGSVIFKARLFGKEKDVKKTQARLSYIPHNLSARYESAASFSTTIDLVPLSLTYDMPSHAGTNTELMYSIDYASAINYPLERMSLKLEPVSGFTVLTVDPPSLDKIEWKLPVLGAGQRGRINVRGMVNANAPSALNFSAKLGMWQNGTFIVIKDLTQSVVVDNSLGSNVQPSAAIAITQKVFYENQSSFSNSGPVPPKVRQTTTYVVNWQVHGDAEKTINNAVVRAMLPENVTIGDDVIPESEIDRISFDGGSRQIVWSLGTLLPKALVLLSFQIAFTPHDYQKGVVAPLISAATATAQDETSGTLIQSSAPAINTSLPDDGANSGGGIIE